MFSIIDTHHCRILVPAHPLHSARSTRDHLDCSEEVWLWWRPGTHTGISVSLVSQLAVFENGSKNAWQSGKLLFFTSTAGSKFLLTAPPSSTTMLTSSFRVFLTNTTKWVVYFGVYFIVILIGIWMCALLTWFRIEIVHSHQRSWKTCSKCFPTCPGVQTSTTPFALMIRDGSPIKDTSHSGRERQTCTLYRISPAFCSSRLLFVCLFG